jgi:hypothetical protein
VVTKQSRDELDGSLIVRDLINSKFIDVLKKNEQRFKRMMQNYWTKDDICLRVEEPICYDLSRNVHQVCQL